MNKELYIGELVSGKRNKDCYLSQDKSFLTMESVITVPYQEAKIKINLNNSDYVVQILSGICSDYDQEKKRSGLSISSEPLPNEATYTFPSNHNYYTINVEKVAGDKVANSSEVSLFCELLNIPSKWGETLEDVEYIRKVNAARLSYRQSENSSGDIGVVGTLPIIVHTSDTHGDYYRVKEIDSFAEKIGASCICATGDFVSHHPAYNKPVSENPTRMYGLGYLKQIIKESNRKWAICPGNHEYIYNFSKPNLVYDALFSGIESKLGKENNGLSTYFTDIVKDKLRIISVDLYKASTVSDTDTRPPGKTYFSQKTIDMVKKGLLTTPKNYGIVIILHSPQATIPMAANKACDKFFQPYRGEETPSYRAAYNYTYGDPIADMVNAYINRAKISKSYGFYYVNKAGETKLVKDGKYNVSVKADFSNALGEFICYMSGHRHKDSVYYLNDDKTHLNYKGKQLMLNVACATPAYGAADGYPYLCDKSDTYRDYEECAHSFNVYAIDRLHKTIKIIKIGANTNYNLKVRDMAVVPYA